MIHKQKGITLIGMLAAVLGIVITAVLIMKAGPVYLQHYTIVQSIKGMGNDLSNQPDDTNLNGIDGNEIKERLNKRLIVNHIDDLDLNKMAIVPNGAGRYKIILKYQVIKPLLYNISLLFSFNEVHEVKVSSEHQT